MCLTRDQFSIKLDENGLQIGRIKNFETLMGCNVKIKTFKNKLKL